MLNSNLIIIMILAPLFGALAQLFSSARWGALLGAGVPLISLSAFLIQGDWSAGRDVFSIKSEWIPHYQAELFLRLNGLNILPLLSLSLVTIFLLVSFYKKEIFSGAFRGIVLLIQAFLTLSLLSGDIFVQMVFWGATAVPLYFLSALYGVKDGKSAFHFLIYSMLGSFFVFIGVLLVYYFSNPHTFDLTAIHSGQFQQATQVILGLSIPEWSFVFILLGFFFRFPLFPFSSWMATFADEMSVEMLVAHTGLFLPASGFILTQLAISIFGIQVTTYHVVFWVLGLTSSFLGALQMVHKKSFSQILNAFGMMFSGVVLLALGSAGSFAILSVGLFTLTAGISVCGMALVYSILEQRGFVWDQAEWKASGVFFAAQSILFGNIAALPATSAFVPMALLLSGTFDRSPTVAMIYMLISLISSFGIFKIHQEKTLGGGADKIKLDMRENALGVFLIIATLVFGLWPREMIKISQPATGELIKNLSQ